MDFSAYITVLLLLIPLIGVLFVYSMPGNKCSRVIGVLFSLLNFLVSLYMLYVFDVSNSAEYQFLFEYELLSFLNINFGVDGISLLFILLTTLLTLICLGISWRFEIANIRNYVMMFLLLESFIIGVFISLDVFLFYIFFESVLIPMFFIIGIWGGQERVYAAFKLFLYTLFGSVFFFIALIYMYNAFGTSDMRVLMHNLQSLSFQEQNYIWIASFIAFAIKIPMWPFHTWLPDAHVQAPTAGSVILAGILLKLGGYGFIRFSLGMLPDSSLFFQDFIFTLSAIAVVYTSLIALMQQDIKKMIAYSSVAHMGFVTAGLFSFNEEGIAGAIYQMISHGLISGALFICIGVLYDRMHTRNIADYGGIANIMPAYAFIFMFFSMASMGLPGTSGFVGEFLSMLGIYKASPIVCAFISTGMVLGAGYMLWLYKRVVFGEVVHKKVSLMKDLYCYEWALFIPLIALTLLYGIRANYILDLIRLPVGDLVANFNV